MKHLKMVWVSFFIIMIIGVFVYSPYRIAALQFKFYAAPVHTQATSDMTPFYWMIAIVGGLIAITLSYVSFRKYKGEEKKRKEKDSNS